MNKIQSALQSKLAKEIGQSVKTAAINMAGAMVLGLVLKGGAKLIEVAADAVRKESEQV